MNIHILHPLVTGSLSPPPPHLHLNIRSTMHTVLSSIFVLMGVISAPFLLTQNFCETIVDLEINAYRIKHDLLSRPQNAGQDHNIIYTYIYIYIYIYPFRKTSEGSAFSTVAGYGLDDWGGQSSDPGRVKILTSASRPHWIWGLPSLLLRWYYGLFPWG
jgi:hypothetical protein